MGQNKWKTVEEAVVGFLSHCLEILAMILMLAMLVIVSWQVLARQIGVVSVWTEEMSRWVFVYLSFAGFALLSVYDNHIRVDALLEFRPIRRISRLLSPVIHLLGLFFYIAVTYASFALIDRFGDAPSASIGVTMRVLYYAPPTAFTVAAILQLRHVVLSTMVLIRSSRTGQENS